MRLLSILALAVSVRAEDCPATELCWDDEKFGIWDCDAEPAPIQVYKNDDDIYVVEKLDVDTGTYAAAIDAWIEAVGIWEGWGGAGRDRGAAGQGIRRPFGV